MRRRKPLPKYMQPGGFLDISRVAGSVRAIIIVLFGSFLIWNFHYFSFWLDSVLGLEHVPATESMIRVRRFWAGVMAGVMIFAGVWKIIWLYWYRKKSIKSAEGQWYDSADLTKEDLYSGEEENVRKEDRKGDQD